jgi:hypothetical protein
MNRWVGYLVAALCAVPCVWLLAEYPLPIWPLIGALVAYVAGLWRWPTLWLIVLPAVLPALDLGLWTGWYVVNEADLFVLATLATLAVRRPPAATDFIPNRWPGAVLLLFLVSYAISVVIGLTAPNGGGLSSNPFLRPDNALRLGKGLVEAIVLLPFLRHVLRMGAKPRITLACGFVLGLILVTAVVLVERALFAGILDFGTDYRVAGPFSSMHVGGGHIGAYTALALPFAFALGLMSLRCLPLTALGIVGGTYTLIVTFARTGYAAGLGGCTVMGLTVLRALWARRGWTRAAVAAAFVVFLLAVAGAAASGVMRQRLLGAADDLITRESNWRAGWAVRDEGVLTDAFGMGLGTYQRTMSARSGVNRPTDFGLSEDSSGRFVWIRMASPFFLGQKIVLPEIGSVHLKLTFRGSTPGAGLAWSVCDKVLLYSDHCQSGQAGTITPNVWQDVSAIIPVAELGACIAGGTICRPVELAVFGSAGGSTFAVRDISMTDDSGRQLLANGDFRQDMDRWIFTDDSHVSWRIFNQYLMLLFETGIVGLVAYLAMAGVAFAGGVRAAWQNDPVGGAIAGAIASFLLSGLFDNDLEAPRLATLFYLICFTGIALWDVTPSRPPSVPSA